MESWKAVCPWSRRRVVTAALAVLFAFALVESAQLSAQILPIQLPKAKPGVVGPWVFMTASDQRIYAPEYFIGDIWHLKTLSVPYDDPAHPATPVPPPVGSMSAFRLGETQPYVVHRSADGQVYLNAYGQWNVSPAKNVTALAGGAPLAASEPAGFDSGGGDYSIFYRGSDGHIYELLTTNPYDDVHWTWSDLTAWTNAPAAVGNPTTYLRVENYNVVLYRGANGHVYELYRPRNGDPHTWQVGDLTALTGAPPASSDLSGFRRPDAYNSVVYRASNGQIYELYVQSGGTWRWGSPSGLASAPLAKGMPSAYARWDGVSAIVYRGKNDHVYELYLRPGDTWKVGDLTLLTSAPLADSDPVGWTFLVTDGPVASNRQNCVAFRTPRAITFPLDVLCLDSNGPNTTWRRSYTGW